MPTSSNISRLRLARERKSWTQQYVAEQLGVSPLTVMRWETGKTVPHAFYRQQLSNLFSLPLEELGVLIPTKRDTLDFEHQSESFPLPFLCPPPISSTHFVGRADEIAALREHLQQAGRIALVGLPGVGKTTLATYIAHLPDIAATYPDGILWLGFGLHPPLPTLLGQLALRLGFPASELSRLADLAVLAQRVHSLIGDRRLLVILDDVWQIEDVAYFTVTGDHTSILLTSRFPAIAHAFSLARTVALAEFDDQQSLALLAQIAPQVVEQHAEPMSDLITAVGGLPLALTLMGWYLQTHHLSGQPRRVQMALTHLRQPDARQHLAEPLPVVDQHRWLASTSSRSLHAVITLSVDHLRAEERALLGTLALFPPKPNTFAEDAGCAISNLAPQDYLTALDRLVDAGLVESASPERYRMHQTIADVAQGIGRDGLDAERMARYYIDLMQKHQGDYALLDTELVNIQMALSTLHRGQQTNLWITGVVALAPLLLGHGLTILAEDYLNEASLSVADAVTKCAILMHLCKCLDHRGAYEQSQGYAHELLTLARQLNHASYICDACRLLGAAVYKQGDITAAQSWFEEGLRVAIQSTDLHEQVLCTLNLGTLLSNTGHTTRAQTFFEQGLTLARRNGQREEILRTLIGLGTTTGITGHFAEAEHYLHEAYVLAQHIGLRERMGWISANLGKALLVQGRFAEAERYLREGLAVARSNQHGDQVCSLLAILTEALTYQGMVSQAEQCAQEGITLARSAAVPQGLCEMLVRGGEVAHRQGNVTVALERLCESLAIAQALGFQRELAEIQQLLGESAFQRGQLPEAKDLFQEALQISQAVHSGEIQVMARFGLAQVMALEGEREVSKQHARMAVVQAQRMGYYLADEIQQWLEKYTASFS